MLQTDFLFRENRASFDDIRKTYQQVYIPPGPFQKISCSLALKIFSRTMTVATAVNIGQIQSLTALNEVDFLAIMTICLTLLTVRCYIQKSFTVVTFQAKPH